MDKNLIKRKDVKDKNLTKCEHYEDIEYYRARVFNDRYIKLHKKHIPLNPKVLIQTQNQYNYYMEVLLYLLEQVELGFNPAWFITFHYQHPVEHTKRIVETSNPLGWKNRVGFKSKRTLWNEVPLYNYWADKRNQEDQVNTDTSQIRNVILKYLYGIKRLNRSDKYAFPNLFFFHEKGKTKLQYHTHILIPQKNLVFSTQDELQDAFDYSIRRRRKCFSKWKSIDVRPVRNREGLIGYLNKETNPNHISFDFYNSIPITQTN